MTPGVVVTHSSHHQDVHKRAEENEREGQNAPQANAGGQDDPDERQRYQATGQHQQGMLVHGFGQTLFPRRP